MLELAYTGLTVLMIMLILLGYHKALKAHFTDKKVRKTKILFLIAALAGWFLYLFILSKNEILFDLSMPPRFLLLLMPFVIFLIVFYMKNKDNQFIQSIPLKWTTLYQTFRVAVEFLLLYTFYKGLIPEQATFEGLNYDVIMGITAPLVAFFMVQEHKKNGVLVYAWNIIGIFMVLFVAFIIATSLYQPQIWGAETPLVKTEFLALPYLLIAGFLAPSAIAMHVVALIQLRGRKD